MRYIIIIFLALVFAAAGCATTGSNQQEGNLQIDPTCYNSLLSQMNEPEIKTSSDPNYAFYRFVWVPSFHPAAVVRFEKNKDGYKLIFKKAKKLYCAANYEEKTKTMDEKEWVEFTKLVNDADFNNMSASVRYGKDGATWTFESLSGVNYHEVEEWSPRKSTRLRVICETLLELTGIELKLY